MEIGNELMGVTEWIPATVPGGVHQDLFRAGLINDPYQDLNSMQCEWVENRWWVYRTRIAIPFLNPEERAELVFKGLDYEAIITLNGIKLGEHAGMYEPAVYDVTEVIRGREFAELQVIFKQAPDEMGQIGKTSETFTQKSRFNYKWDFSTRLVNVGIWDDVWLRILPTSSLGDIALHTDVDEAGTGWIRLAAEIRQPGSRSEVLVTLLNPEGHSVACLVEQMDDGRVHFEIPITSPQLWYPNGYGDQPLYEVNIRLVCDDTVMDERKLYTGIRRLEYSQNEGSPADALPYTFIVNGRRIYIQGANLTPLDHLYGNVCAERYDWIVHLAKHSNLNMLRIWGGGLIEKTYLYELCDRYGILIWQEFIQSSSGIDNVPSQRPEFLKLLERTAVTALKDRRNHVSLAVWSGGNELMSEPNRPSTYADTNLSFLKALVAKHDPHRLFLPTSASGPVQYITREKGVSHDVHGHWKFEGNPDHYSLYGEADHLFHSEFGVDGVSCVKSLRKFLSEPHLKPVSMKDSLVWRHHGEWWDTYDRDKALFGQFESLSQFSDASQWIQAEGLRFILEANRRRQFRNSGSIIWQMNEPWPNASCTNLVDYYMEPKMAYYWTRQSFSRNHFSLDYRKLHYTVGEKLEADVYVHQGLQPAYRSILVEVLDTKGNVHDRNTFRYEAEECSVAKVGQLRFIVPQTDDGLFIVRLREQGEGSAQTNDYFFSTLEQAIYEPALRIEPASLHIETVGDWVGASMPYGMKSTVWTRTFTITNHGQSVALHIRPEERTDQYWMAADASFFSLFPGESRVVNVSCLTRTGELFKHLQESVSTDIRPDIAFRTFGSEQLVISNGAKVKT
ncbi:glycoside hydrolase family 2 protein [Paenibacillus aurantiacus]|uniref:beta-mannosidase n=1 Tax=Paenibacillus aurantiacus TaxID=1936118 RepID=A0ABV5KHN2_9BACL